MPDQITADTPSEKTEIEPANGQAHQPDVASFPVVVSPYHRPGVNWRLIIWSVLITLAVIMLVAYGQAIFFVSPGAETGVDIPRFIIPLSPTPAATPSVTPTAMAGANPLTFAEPTALPTPVSGGQILILTPTNRDEGWVVSDAKTIGEDETVAAGSGLPNHFGDSFLYAGVLEGQTYHAAIQFDLGRIPRGTKIYAASLRLTGLRADQLGQAGQWRLQLLASDIDHRWRDHNYEQIHQAASGATFEPVLTPNQLGDGQINQFDFNPTQLALLERRLWEGSDRFGKKVSFRLDGPPGGDNNLFAWDSGYGSASRGAGPELFLSLGPPPPGNPTPLLHCGYQHTHPGKCGNRRG